MLRALAVLAEHPRAVGRTVTERLLAIAEEDPPYTVPHGQHRRLRVAHLRCRLAGIADALAPEARARVDALPD